MGYISGGVEYFRVHYNIYIYEINVKRINIREIMRNSTSYIMYCIVQGSEKRIIIIIIMGPT